MYEDAEGFNDDDQDHWDQQPSIEEDEMPWGEEAVLEVDGMDWEQDRLAAQGRPSMAGASDRVGLGSHLHHAAAAYHDDVELERETQQNEYSNISIGVLLCLSTAWRVES